MNLISITVMDSVNNIKELLINPDAIVSLEKEYDYYVLRLVDGRVLKLTELQYQEQFVQN
jgi:hypothetical protein